MRSGTSDSKIDKIVDDGCRYSESLGRSLSRLQVIHPEPYTVPPLFGVHYIVALLSTRLRLWDQIEEVIEMR